MYKATEACSLACYCYLVSPLLESVVLLSFYLLFILVYSVSFISAHKGGLRCRDGDNFLNLNIITAMCVVTFIGSTSVRKFY